MNTMTREQKITRAKALTAAQSTDALKASLLMLENTLMADPDHVDGPALRLTRSWVIDELEGRFPEASAAVERAFVAWDSAVERGEDVPEVNYVAVLLASIPV